MNKPLQKLRPTKPNELEDRLAKAHEWTTQADRPQGGFPWELANERVKIGYQLRIGEPLHAKLKFLSEHEPNSSMHKIIIDAVEKEVERRLQKYIGEGNAST